MQHYFLLSLIVAISSIGGVIVKLGADRATSISLHATKHKTLFFVVAGGITISLILNALYLFGWLVPQANLSIVGTSLYLVLLSFLFITAWIPDIPGRLRMIHRLTGYGAVGAMPLVLIAVFMSVQMSLLTQIVVDVATIAHFIMIYLLFFVPAAYRHFLVYQGIYLAVFFIAILSVTYL